MVFYQARSIYLIMCTNGYLYKITPKATLPWTVGVNRIGTASLTTAVITPVTGNIIAWGASDGYVRLFDYTTNAIKKTLHRHIVSSTAKAVLSVSVIPTTPKLIISTASDYYIRISWENGTVKSNLKTATYYPIKMIYLLGTTYEFLVSFNTNIV